MQNQFGHLDDYKESSGNCCPNCGSEEFGVGVPAFSERSVKFKNRCKTCEVSYIETYTLTSVSDTEGNTEMIDI